MYISVNLIVAPSITCAIRIKKTDKNIHLCSIHCKQMCEQLFFVARSVVVVVVCCVDSTFDINAKWRIDPMKRYDTGF